MAGHTSMENVEKTVDSVEMTQFESKGILQLRKIEAEPQ